MHVAHELGRYPPGSATPWDAVVHLGLESVAKGLRVEIAAANVLAEPALHGWSVKVPCNKTGTEYSEIWPGGPCLLATTAPLDHIFLDDVSGVMPPPQELWSRDAGTYFCNEALYRTLFEVRSRRLRPLHGRSQAASNSAANAALLPAAFIHLPTANTTRIAASVDTVRHLAAQMAGRFLPPVPAMARAARLGALPAATAVATAVSASDGVACAAPSGRYEGTQSVMGYAVQIRAEARRKAHASGGTLDLAVSSSGDLITFECDGEAWSLHGEETEALRTSRVVVKADACWHDNVEGNIDDLQLAFDAVGNTVHLTGRHRIAFFSLPLEATLRALDPCPHPV